jgi:hypothetical protein
METWMVVVVAIIFLWIFRGELGIFEEFKHGHRVMYYVNKRETASDPYKISAGPEDNYPKQWASHPFGYMFPLENIH